MTCSDGTTPTPILAEPVVQPAEPDATQPGNGARLRGYRRRLRDGSLQTDPDQIAHALLRCGVLR